MKIAAWSFSNTLLVGDEFQKMNYPSRSEEVEIS